MHFILSSAVPPAFNSFEDETTLRYFIATVNVFGLSIPLRMKQIHYFAVADFAVFVVFQFL